MMFADMKKAILFTTVALAAFAPLAVGDETTKMQKIEELCKLSKVDQMQAQVIEQMKGNMAQMFARTDVPADAKAVGQEMQAEMVKLVSDRLTWDKMKPDVVKLYDETVSEQEIDGILSFYRSPAGRAMLDKMPVLMSKSMQLVQKQIGELMPEIMKIAERVGKKYPAQQPKQ